ncbi:class I SAM-dependent methyltransferase [uncultured Cellulomonas sp.]|uniref:class I SAM-dependent methyltransferase n=1 Tax=uncultured Cellulomonas sp. TaxID=189682 RepID=UPI00262D632A|nr:class I SAM-dependent methyltransferase [uncultured Cellulomonas sp.]
MFARLYSRLSPGMDRQGVAEHRQRLLAGLAGRVVEVGAGDGLNFARYPPTVSTVLALEPEPYLRRRAGERAVEAPVPVDVVDAAGENIPAADGSVDAVVASLVLCSVRHQDVVLAEMWRVLRPGGELRFYEHVAAPDGGRLRTVQRVVDATVWPHLVGGCHTGRATEAAISAAGFVIDDVDRFHFPPGQASPAAPHVLGWAHRPAARPPGRPRPATTNGR